MKMNINLLSEFKKINIKSKWQRKKQKKKIVTDIMLVFNYSTHNYYRQYQIENYMDITILYIKCDAYTHTLTQSKQLIYKLL